MEILVPIAVALIGGPLVVIINQLYTFRKENKKDHGDVMGRTDEIINAIREVKSDVKSINTKLTSHLKWHKENDEA
jgi:hypothetical protein